MLKSIRSVTEISRMSVYGSLSSSMYNVPSTSAPNSPSTASPSPNSSSVPPLNYSPAPAPVSGIPRIQSPLPPSHSQSFAAPSSPLNSPSGPSHLQSFSHSSPQSPSSSNQLGATHYEKGQRPMSTALPPHMTEKIGRPLSAGYSPLSQSSPLSPATNTSDDAVLKGRAAIDAAIYILSSNSPLNKQVRTVIGFLVFV